MSSLALMHSTRTEINNAPIVNGQIFIETDQIGTNYNKIYLDNNRNRIELGVSEWDSIINKPFETLGESFESDNGQLNAGIAWINITNKPFNDLGNGINVSIDKKLNTDIYSLECDWYGNTSTSQGKEQAVNINGTKKSIHGSFHMEKEMTLSTIYDNIYTFHNSKIENNSQIEVYTSICGMNPRSVTVTNNKCVITFPKYGISNTQMKCRIYIL